MKDLAGESIIFFIFVVPARAVGNNFSSQAADMLC